MTRFWLVGTVISSGVVASEEVTMVNAAVEMDPNVVEAATQFLVGTNPGALAADMAEIRAVDLPEDTVDLRRALMAFEDVRVAFDRRFADGLGGAVGRLTAAVREVRGADAAPFMQGPAAGSKRAG
jgi:hypothetical protein